MINKLKSLLADVSSPDWPSSESSVSNELAAAALLVEVMAADYEQHPEEKQMLHKVLKRQFGLTDAEAETLLNEAIEAHFNATDYFHFTREINQHYSQPQKIELIEAMWKMADADDEIQAVEQHVIRRIASLIHVSHSDFIAAKLKVTGY